MLIFLYMITGLLFLMSFFQLLLSIEGNIKEGSKVIVIEEMVYSGSLSSQVESLAWKTKSKTDLHVFTLKDKFIHCYGSHEQLLNKHEISVPKILKKI